MELQPLRARCFLHVSNDTLGIRTTGRVHQQGDHPSLRNQLGKQRKALSRQLVGDEADSREVAARPREARDKTSSHRVAATPEDDRDRRGRAFRGECRRRAARHDQIDLAADEIGGQCGQPIVIALRPAVFDRQILSLDVAGFAQSLAERHKQFRKRPAGRPGAEDADHRHRLLLRARSERPCGHHAAEKCNEFPPPHEGFPTWTDSKRAEAITFRGNAGCAYAAKFVGQCLRWVINRPDGPEIRRPLYPRKRTQVGHRAMSEMCSQLRTSGSRHDGPID